MILKAIAIGLVMALGLFSDKGMGDPMLRRPLVMAPIVGLLLGNLEKGIVMGATLEVVFLGTSQIGGALPSDSMTGSIFGTAFAILTNQSTQIALTLSIPIAILAVSLNQFILFVVGLLEEKFQQSIDKNNYRRFVQLHYGMIGLQVALYFFVGFVGLLAGTTAIQHLLNIIPTVIMNGLNLAGKMLPALGIALLLNMLWDSKLAVFGLFGFVLSAYAHLPLIAIACIGLVVSVAIGLQDHNTKKMVDSVSAKTVTNNNSLDDDKEDDFFD